MTDVWLFGEFYCVSQLNSSDTKDRKKAKWRSQIKVPQGSVIERNGNILYLDFNNSLVSYPVYLTDLEYQLRDTGYKPDSRRPIYSKKFQPNVDSTYLWFKRISTTEYEEYVNPLNPTNPNPNAFQKPLPTPKPLIDLGYLDFVEERLEIGFDFGAVGGMAFSTEIVEVAGGKEQRNALRYLPLGRWQLGDRTLLESEIDQIEQVSYLKNFHRDRLGSYQGFRFRDWSDYQAVEQLIGTGDGVTTSFQLHKAYGVGDAIFYRPITKPNYFTFQSNFQLLPSGFQIEVVLDSATGIVTLDQPLPLGALFFASFEFDIPVWFESDQIGFKLEGYSEDTNEAIYRLESVFVVEGRIPIADWVAAPMPQIHKPLDLGIIYETIEQQEFATVKQELKSGYVKRDSKRADSHLSFNLGSRNYDKDEIAEILRYFWLAKGKLSQFPFKNLNKIYTVRFDQDELNLKFEGGLYGYQDSYLTGSTTIQEYEEYQMAIFSLPGLKLQVVPSLGLYQYLDPDTYLYFVVDTSGTIDNYLDDIYESHSSFVEILKQRFGDDYAYKCDIFGYSDERWLTIPVYYPQPKAVYVIFTCEAAPAYHSTLTFTPATTTFDSDRAAYIDAFEGMDFCKVIVISLSAPDAAFDIFNGQLFAAREGVLGYSPPLKDYGLELELNIHPWTNAEQWLDYYATGNITHNGGSSGGSGFPSSGLIHYYKLETLPPLSDSVGNSPLTTINSALGSLVTGVNGNGLFYQYGGDGFGGNPLRSADTSFSVSFWYKVAAVNDNDVIFGDQKYPEDVAGTLMAYFFNDSIALWLTKSDYSTSNYFADSAIADGNWHNIVLSFDNTSKDLHLYIDNALQFTANTGLGLSLSTEPVWFNVAVFTSGVNQSSFDEIGIWDIALGAGQVAALWNNGAGSFF